MPPKKRNIGQVQRKAKRQKLMRAAETTDQRNHRLQEMRVKSVVSSAAETAEERETRVQQMREAASTSKAAMNSNLILEGFNYDPYKDYKNHPSVIIGRMDHICRYCNAKKFKTESPGMCCRSGKVQLPPLEQVPNTLLHYMSGTSPKSKHFLKNIRRYNSCFQMTSFGATSAVEESGFPITFKVQGQVYHKAGSLLPPSHQSPKFLQIYFMGDEQVEADQRCAYIPGVRREIVLDLQRMLHEKNQLISTFKTALERMPSDEYKVVIRADKRPMGEHERRFATMQLACIFLLAYWFSFVPVRRTGKTASMT